MDKRNIMIQTEWRNKNLKNDFKPVHIQQYESVDDLNIEMRGTEWERLYKAGNWVSIKIIDADTKKLIIGIDIDDKDTVYKCIKFIKKYKSENGHG